jgi:hypothetical protein
MRKGGGYPFLDQRERKNWAKKYIKKSVFGDFSGLVRRKNAL